MKKLLIKIMAFALMIVFVLGAVACGQTGNPSNPGGDPSGPSSSVKNLKIVENGKSEYKILISDQASLVEVNASNELAKYLKSVTGATLPVVLESTVRLSVYEKYISIGETQLKEKANIDNKNLNLDGYVLQSVANTLFIVGENGAGTLFGVYGFLDDYCGVKFLTAEYEYIPQVKTLEFSAISDREIPAVSNRTIFNDGAEMSKVFNAKLRTKAYRLGDCVELGGKYGDLHKLGVHSLGTFVWVVDYYDAHPEWWGHKKDLTDRNTPCFTNGLNLETGRLVEDSEMVEDIYDTDPEHLKYYLEAVIKKFKRLILATNNPLEYYVLGQPDGQKLCTCETCLEQLDTIEGSRTAQFMIWSNAVAIEIDEWIEENYKTDPRLTVNGERKQVRFLRDAYQWSVAAPVKKDATTGEWVPLNDLCKPARNMGVYFIPITGCFLHGLLDDSCETNVTTTGLYFKQWMAICDNFAVFTYNIDYKNFLAFFPCLSAVSDDIRAYANAGVQGLILEGGLSGSGAFYQQDMLGWASAKLLWNPNLNLMDLMHEYNKYYFGEQAGAIVDEMVAYMQAHSEIYGAKTGSHVGVYGGFVSKNCLTEPYINRLNEYVAEIENIYKNANISESERTMYMSHLDKLSVQVDYMKYKNYDETFATTTQAKYDFMKGFFDKCESVGVKSFTEGGTSIRTIRQQLGF